MNKQTEIEQESKKSVRVFDEKVKIYKQILQRNSPTSVVSIKKSADVVGAPNPPFLVGGGKLLSILVSCVTLSHSLKL